MSKVRDRERDRIGPQGYMCKMWMCFADLRIVFSPIGNKHNRKFITLTKTLLIGNPYSRLTAVKCIETVQTVKV